MNKVVSLFFLISFSLVISTARAVELKHEFKAREGFTLHLPDNWIEIPDDFLRQYSEKVSQLAPQIEKQIYDYGFQLAPVDTWMTHPYILIQVKKTGRIPEEKLKQYKQIDEAFSTHIDGIENHMPGILSGSQLGEMLYDVTNQILWMLISFDLQQKGIVNAQIAVKPTEFGIIQVTGYATKESFISYQPVFQEIARQMILDESIKYKSLISDNDANSNRVLKVFILCAIIGGIIGLIVWLIKRKRIP